MATSIANLDTTQYVKINSERMSITLQSHRDEVRIALSDVKPARDNTVFHTLIGGDDPLQFQNIESDVWVLATTSQSRLSVTETGGVGVCCDFKYEVAKGNIEGHSFVAIVARNPSVESSEFEDLWGGGELPVPEKAMVFPTAPETWEIVSDNANDTSTGSGARTAVVLSLDENKLEQFQIVTLNGTTPVTLTGTHFRADSVLMSTAGATGVNEGTIVLRVSGGGNARNIVLPGVGRSHDGQYTVPLDKDAYILTTQILYPKDGSGLFRNPLKPDAADSSWISGSVLSPYQNSITFPFESSPKVLGGTDLRLEVKADSGVLDVTTIFELLLVDKSL